MTANGERLEAKAKEQYLRFYGGAVGAVLPFLLFVVSIIYITSKGMITMAAYFGPLVIIVGLVILLAKDRQAASNAMIEGATDRTVAVMIFAFLGAGVLARLLVVSGAVNAMVWLGIKSGVTGTAFIIVSFLIAALIASSTGTSTGTVVTCVPLLYPAGVMLGANAALLLGAIYSGARFGDNIAPISDTTIASTQTQGAVLGEAFRTRLKYAFVAAGVSIVLYSVLGFIMGPGNYATAGMDMNKLLADYAKPNALPMLLAPAITIYLCLRGRSLIQAIWFGIFGGIIIGLATRVLVISDLLMLKAPKEVGGALIDGVIGMRDVIFLIIFVMAILAVLKKAGVLDAISRWIMKSATTPKKAELAIMTLETIMYPLCAVNTPSMILTGPIVKEIGEKFGITPNRRANLLDMAANGVTGNLPHINTMLALGGAMLASSADTGVPIIPLVTVGLLAFHSTMLTIVGYFAIITGWGSKD